MRDLKIYRNEDVEEIVAAIPRGHYHIRLLIRFRDQDILLNEATVSAITRAYLSILLHPTRRGVVLVKREFGKDKRKTGYAPVQLVEAEGFENKAVDIISEIVSSG